MNYNYQENLKKNAIWGHMDSLGEILSEKTILSYNPRTQKIILYSQPSEEIDLEDFLKEHKPLGTTKNKSEDMLGLNKVLKGFMGAVPKLKENTPKQPVTKEEAPDNTANIKYNPQTEEVKVDGATEKAPKVDLSTIDPKIISVIDLTKESLKETVDVDGVSTPNAEQTMQVLQLMKIDVDAFADAVCQHPDLSDVVKCIVRAFFNQK